jgi:hypothetical protein
MTWIADAGLWAAIALVGLVAGLLAPWSRPDGRRPAFVDGWILAAAAAAVAAVCARAGQVLSTPSLSPLLAAYLPIEAGPVAQLAVLWATLPGGALTSATILLVWLAMSPDARAGRGGSLHAFVVAVVSLCLLGATAWFAPGPGLATAIPPFAQHPSAAVAPLLALLSVTVLAWAGIRAFTQQAPARTELYVAWLLATGAIVCEQVARSSLGIGPRDAIVLGSASSGLVLWLAISAMLHQAVRVRVHRGSSGVVRSRPAAMMAHAGALCVVASFALHAVAARSSVVLPAGQSVEVTDAFRKPWQLVNQGVSRFDEEGVEVTSLAVEARNPRGKTVLLTPELREFHGFDGEHLESGISRRRSAGGPFQAMRLLFTEADSLDAGSVRVTFLPVPILWPIGITLLVFAAAAGLSARGPLNSGIVNS